MSYTVEIVIGRPPGPESDGGLPAFKLPHIYSTVSEASDAAVDYLKANKYGPGEAWFHLFDHDGNLVVDPTRTIAP
jgi:hypothetical protein